MDARKAKTSAEMREERRNPVPPANTPKPGELRHGAYTLHSLLRRTGPVGWRARALIRDLRLNLAVAKGYATWESVPRPAQALIEIAVELDLFRRLLFSGFWRGEDVPKRYDGVTELQRRVLGDLGIEPALQEPDVIALLAGMRKSDRSDKPRPGPTGEAS